MPTSNLCELKPSEVLPPWPASRLYHEQSKLTERRTPLFLEQVAAIDCGAGTAPATSRPLAAEPIALPRASARRRGPGLMRVMRRRRSQRGPFAAGSISPRRLGALLQVGFGHCGAIELPGGTRLPARSWPSAGALEPLELYVVPLRGVDLGPFACRYGAPRHELLPVAPRPDEAALRRAVFAGELWEGAAMLLVLTAVFERTQSKYGERGYRFALLEAGHAGQGLLLMAEALGLGAVVIGGFREDDLASLLGLDAAAESPISAILVGSRRSCRFH